MTRKRIRHVTSESFGVVRQSGAALVITLAFVVLLTVFAVAFFTRAASERQVAYTSASQSKAELLARGALAITIGDLKQEICAGSTISTVATTTIYSPKAAAAPSPATLTPALSGASGTAGLENLLKRSASGLAFYPSASSYDTVTYPPSNRAAGPSLQSATTVVSKNGRYVSLARWNKPLLLQKATPASDTDITPVNGFTAPDWILMARDGSNPTAWNVNLVTSLNLPASVIGRYAYTIYDEGGLIDMNVAGYPTVSTSAQVGRKGPIVYADLKQIPGISSLSATNQTKFVNNIVGWRNFVSGAASGSLGTFASGNNYSFASGDSYYLAIQSNINGFLLTSNKLLSGNQSDRMLGSRQELTALLIRGMASTIADRANLQVALQYLGTFSRELNGPSWKPTPTSAINPDLNSVRVGTPFNRPDGKPAVLGEPLMKTRFALPRINELTNTANSYIQRDFGLQWDSSNNRWNYVGSTGSTVQSSIRMLSQIPAEIPGREPNFFEVLKAVITNGSIGLGSGPLNTFIAAEAKYYDTTGSASADYQIMQIGANIIDEWDSDNLPTFVNFANSELAGVENLPYLNKLVLDFWVSNNGNGGAHDQVYAWLVPSLWNPHQNASAATGDVRFAMTSGSVNAVLVNKNPATDPSIISGPIPNGAPYPYIQVRANAFATACPPVPSPTPIPASSSPPGNEATPAPGVTPKVGQVTVTTKDTRLYDGLDFNNPIDTTRNNWWKLASRVYPYFAPGTTFQMQVPVVSGATTTWKAYQTWANCYNGDLPSASLPSGAPLVYNSSGSYKNNSSQDPEFVSIDPRTTRFGVWGSDASTSGDSADTKNYIAGAEDTTDQRAASGGLEIIAPGIRPQPTTNFAMGSPKGLAYLYAANSSTTDYYKDLDGVKRPGDPPSSSLDGVSNTKTVMYASASPPALVSPTPRAVDRPQVPNAASGFQSVAEMGQVFRDQPWKTLNFTSALSGDAGLLDAFTLQDVSMTAGRTSLNTKQAAVLKAILSQTIAKLSDTTGATIITTTQRDNIVTALMALTAANPMISKGELVTKLAADASVTVLGNKEAREAVIRAFADACQTRTWNLMIDVIAQSGRYPPTANGLADFLVEGEKRYWLHIAIDRFTGEVIDQQLEAVYE